MDSPATGVCFLSCCVLNCQAFIFPSWSWRYLSYYPSSMFGICVFSLIISWWFSHFRIIHKPNFSFYSAFYVTFLRISVTLSGLNDLFLMAYLLSSLCSLCVWKPSRLPEKIERWMKPSSCSLSWVLGEEDGERQALLALIPTGWLVPSEGSTQSLWGVPRKHRSPPGRMSRAGFIEKVTCDLTLKDFTSWRV